MAFSLRVKQGCILVWIQQRMQNSLLVVWPNQHYQLLTNIAANKQLLLEEDNAKDTFIYKQFFTPEKEVFTEATAIKANWQHHEKCV